MRYLEYLKNMVAGSLTSAPSVVIYIAIIALFLLGLIRCVLPVSRNKRLIKKAIGQIRNGGDRKYAWQEDEFLGKGTLFAHWADYLNNLFFADGRYHNASNVQDYINEETVIYGPGRVSFCEALPGLLTSLGFLGTLIGLATGLSGFSLTDSAAVQESIVTLIPGMRYAFMTSIFGVVGSVLFTLITRAVYGSTEHTLTQFYAAMSRYAGVLSVEPLTQIAIYQQEQTALIKNMAKDINNKYTEAITKSLEPMNETMKGFVNGISREQARLIDGVLEKFLERMNESLNGSLKRFGKTLDETSALQRENSEAVKQSLSGAADVFNDLVETRAMVQEMMEGLSSYINQLNEARKQADEAYGRLEAAVDKMGIVSRQQSDYMRSVGAMQASLDKATENMTAQLNKLQEGITAELNASAKSLEDAAQSLSGVHAEAARQVQDELNTTLDSYRDYVNQFTQRVDYLASNISKSLEQMPDAVNEANNRFLDEIDALTHTLQQAQRNLDVSTGRGYRN